MVVIHPVSAGREWYWSAGPEPGQWYGRSAGSLGFEGEVTLSDLRRALGGGPLARVSRTRRDGFDVIIASPKSVSLLAALAGPPHDAAILSAHRAAVLETLGFLDRHALRIRGPAGQRPRGLLPTDGMLAAVFRHGENRLGDPHLHTHVVVANLCRVDGRWRCLDSRSLFAHGRAAGAVYQSALREALSVRGLVLEWHMRAGGLADVDGVPRAAIDVCSAGKREFRRPSATAVGRGVAGEAPTPWPQRAAAAGFGPSDAAGLLDAATSRMVSSLNADPGDDALMSRLESLGSTFRFADAVIASASSPAGARAAEVERRAARLIERGIAVEATALRPRWTTAGQLARRREIAEQAVARHACRPPAGAVAARVAEAVVALRPGMSPPSVAATMHLLLGGHGVTVVKTGSSLAAAQVIEAAAAGWTAGYHCVELVGPASQRGHWRVLTGIPPAGRLPTVLVVAGAEQLAPPDLSALLGEAARHRTKVVLVDTGRRVLNDVVGDIAERLGHLGPGPFGIEPDPAGVRSTVVAAPSLGDAMSLLARDAIASGLPATAPSAEEVATINAEARAAARAAGVLHGPPVAAAGQQLQVGDRILVLKGDRRLATRAGEFGSVVAAAPSLVPAELVVKWDSGRRAVIPIDALTRASLGYGYATTPAFAPSGAVLELGTTHVVAPGAPEGPGVLAGLVSAARSAPAVEVARTVARARMQLRRPVSELSAELTTAHGTGYNPAAGPDSDPGRRRAVISTAVELRAHLLGSAMVRQPSRAVEAAIGPSPPPGSEELVRWQRAAAAIEVHRERFGLPDEPLDRRHKTLEPVRAAAELAVAALCREIGEDRGRSLA